MFWLEIHSLINATFGPPCAMYVPCCSIRAVSTAQATPDQHPEQTQIEQWPDFGNIAKRQTRPSLTRSTFSVVGALPGRCCASVARSSRAPCTRLACGPTARQSSDWATAGRRRRSLRVPARPRRSAHQTCAWTTAWRQHSGGVVAWSERDRAVRRQLPAELSSCLALLLRIGPPLPAARRPEL